MMMMMVIIGAVLDSVGVGSVFWILSSMGMFILYRHRSLLIHLIYFDYLAIIKESENSNDIINQVDIVILLSTYNCYIEMSDFLKPQTNMDFPIPLNFLKGQMLLCVCSSNFFLLVSVTFFPCNFLVLGVAVHYP